MSRIFDHDLRLTLDFNLSFSSPFCHQNNVFLQISMKTKNVIVRIKTKMRKVIQATTTLSKLLAYHLNNQMRLIHHPLSSNSVKLFL